MQCNKIHSQQSNLIKGKIINAENKAIENALIYFLEDPNIHTHSKTDGSFTLNNTKKFPYLLIEHFAYKTDTVYIQEKAKENFITIILEEKETALEELVIFSDQQTVTPSLNKIKAQHQRIAGGTSVAVMTPENQRLETIKDALKYEPGVVIQELFGANDHPRLSLRGSGIQSNPQSRGVYLLQDGIPINFADGSFIIGVVDPAISESIEVFKGANALRYGAATLGGAINFNSKTGKYNQGIQLKAEGGSYGYMQGNLMMGNQWKRSDAFLSVSGSQQNGFRQHNHNEKLNAAMNYGYRFSNHIDNRLFLNYSYTHFDIPGPLTLEMLLEDPSQINKGIDLPYYMGPNIERDQPSREAEVFRIANQTLFKLSSQTTIHLSLYYQVVKDRFVNPIALSTQRTSGNDLGLILKTTHKGTRSIFTSGFLTSYGTMLRNGHINLNGKDSYMFSKDRLTALNFTLYSEYDYNLTDRWQVIGNIQLVSNQRNTKDEFPHPELRPWYSHSTNRYRYFYSENQSLNQTYYAFNPRLGSVYHLGKNKDMQIFGNISGSYEPPTFNELMGTKVSNNINTSPKEFYTLSLKKQSAITAEIGSRFVSERYSWNISFYRSWLKNELLEVKDFVLGLKNTSNYPHTIHQGIEFGGTVVPFKNIFSEKDQLSLQAMYTLSDFYFNSGVYNGNKIAGIPQHYATAALTYKTQKGFFTTINLESQPTKNPIDHTNTVYQPAFTLIGCSIGIENWHNFSFYIEGKNICNTYYASSYIISDQILLPPIPFPEFSANNLAFFIPGQTRAFYMGVTYKF